MAALLISQYRKQAGALAVAVYADDIEMVAELDMQISDVWRRILALVPRDQNDQVTLITFLLDQLITHTENCERELMIKGKILRLI